jgi:anti-sigma28 factor (negative regulator of flagellin synthesis)
MACQKRRKDGLLRVVIQPATFAVTKNYKKNLTAAEMAARQLKISALSKAVRAGTYWVSSYLIAEKILGHTTITRIH